MKKDDVEQYEKLHSQLITMKVQFEALSKKDPNGSVNSFKLGLVNKLLSDVNSLIGEYKPFPEFEQFEDEPKVFNSDVLMIIAHYLTAMGRFKDANTTKEKSLLNTDWLDTIETWNTED